MAVDWWLVPFNTAVTTAVSNTTVVNTLVTTVGLLPDPGVSGAGARAFVTDEGTGLFATVVSGSGPWKVPVYSDGTNWRVG
jgi:hypothetical protein